MKVTLLPGGVNGTVKAIPSKSHLHRLLIFAALADKPTALHFEHSNAEDIKATADCLSALGAKIETLSEGFMVTPINQERLPNKAVLPCMESGSTLRFMLPVVCALGVSAEFVMAGRLPERPLAPLDAELTRGGIRLWRKENHILCCEGKLAAGDYTLPGNVSSQYISGMLMALPLLNENSTLTIEGTIESADYIAMTTQAAAVFGFEEGYDIRGGVGFKSPGKVSAEGDWSNAAFWLCAGAMPDGNIEISGLDKESTQGDKEIFNILKSMGGCLESANQLLRVQGITKTHGTEIDARAIPDLVPVLCAVAAVSIGETVIKNAERLRLKESDRLAATAQTLNALGAKITEEKDGLRIQGVERLLGGTVDSWGDHRIAMMAAIASLACEREVIITGAQAVRKSYPGFWETFAALGKKIIIEE